MTIETKQGKSSFSGPSLLIPKFVGQSLPPRERSTTTLNYCPDDG